MGICQRISTYTYSRSGLWIQGERLARLRYVISHGVRDTSEGMLMAGMLVTCKLHRPY